MKIDFTEMTWIEMRDVLIGIWLEVKRRNPSGIDMYRNAFRGVYDALKDISENESGNEVNQQLGVES